MFHVKQSSIKELYLSELRAWNRIHRLTGSNDLDLLYSESKESLKSIQPTPTGWVDIGAGSGILTAPALIENRARTVFVEPDIKKAAFLIHFKTLLRKVDSDLADNMMILGKKIQDVSRETLDQFFQGAPYTLAARAFSGIMDLKDAVAQSEMKNFDVFFFTQSQPNKFVLEKL